MRSDPVISASAAAAYSDPWSGSSPTLVRFHGGTGNMQFVTYGDMLQMDLARRLDNPGYNNLGGTQVRFQSLSWSDQSALANRFCLQSSAGATSTLETLFSVTGEASLNSRFCAAAPNPLSPGNAQAVSSQAYAPANIFATTPAAGTRVGTASGYNFDAEVSGTGVSSAWAAASAFMPRRAILVARSPVSDNVPWDTQISWNPQYNTTGTLEHGGSPGL